MTITIKQLKKLLEKVPEDFVVHMVVDDFSGTSEAVEDIVFESRHKQIVFDTQPMELGITSLLNMKPKQ
jgi:hypothetical protein